MLSILGTLKFLALGAIIFVLFPNLDWRWYWLLGAYAVWMICDDREKAMKRDEALDQTTSKIIARVDDLQRNLERFMARHIELSTQTERDIQEQLNKLDDTQKQLGRAEGKVDDLASDPDISQAEGR
jgi:uncharacterized protein with von Willebrand factor type A (vWA) domain